eukprot:TRINITY_DN5841_c0_g1_i3.p1 TRINITY_DN5841_c0_g1~~TRINITY_DN5841_c0_g1_i3.p1  ORF type:complete len:272 (+),score=48.14 TRINITY_DN5841_c0_g1_i3:62-877(+)
MATALARTVTSISLFVVGCSAGSTPLCCACQEWDTSKADTVVKRMCVMNELVIEEIHDADACKLKGGTLAESTCSQEKMGATLLEKMNGGLGEAVCTMSLKGLDQCCKGGSTSGFRNDGQTCQDAPSDVNKGSGSDNPQCCTCDEWDASKDSNVLMQECHLRNGQIVDPTLDAAACQSEGGSMKDVTCAEAKMRALFEEPMLAALGEVLCNASITQYGPCCQGGSTSGFRNDGKKCGAGKSVAGKSVASFSARKFVSSSIVLMMAILFSWA